MAGTQRENNMKERVLDTVDKTGLKGIRYYFSQFSFSLLLLYLFLLLFLTWITWLTTG